MAAGLFRSEERRKIEALAAIPYANPFTEERPELARAVLGAAYESPPRYLLPGQPLHRLDGNLGALVEIAETLLRNIGERLRRRSSISPREKSLVEGVTHFVVFHRHASEFDAALAQEGEPGGARVGQRFNAANTFERCRRDFESILGHEAMGIDVNAEAPRWFAFYFQVRRAWVHTFAFIQGGSDALRALRARIWQSIFTHDMRRYQRGLFDRMDDITTLILGPSGSGKELVARAIGLSRFVPYDVPQRAFAADFAESFHPLNLSALSPTLIESELFGHQRGAFTGALADRAGHLETCGDFGTVFLDEIGETAPEIQVKLLRVLQTRQFQRLGDTASRVFKGRVVAATHQDLPTQIRAGRFREDFFFRLYADQITTPPLVEIVGHDLEELHCLVAHICAKQAGAEEGGKLADEVTSWIEKSLGRSYPWPGNFRELEQCVRNILVHGEYRPPATFGLPGQENSERTDDWVGQARAGALTLDEILQHYCSDILASAGSLEEASRRLGVDRRTVRRYVRMRGAADN